MSYHVAKFGTYYQVVRADGTVIGTYKSKKEAQAEVYRLVMKEQK
jgi:hypothetical protein